MRRQAAPRGYKPDPEQTAANNKVFRELTRNGKILLSAVLPGLRRNAAINLGRLGKTSAYGFLRRGMWDPEADVVLAVVKAITRLKIHQAGPELGALYLKTSRQVKLAILDFTGDMVNYPSFAAILSLGLQDADPVIRNYMLMERPGRAEFN